MNTRSKKFKIIFAILIGIFMIISTLFLVLYYKEKKEVDDIEKIEILTGGYLLETSSYTIDFNTNKVYCNIQDEDIVHSVSSDFDDDNKELFVSKANLYGMFYWKELYKPTEDIYDGKYTEIYITYSDGSYQEILCSNDYPLTYDKMKEVFCEAFGYNML